MEMGRLETGQVCGTGSASRFRSIRCRLSKWIASGLKFQMPSTWPIWPNQLPAKWQPFKFATLHSGVALNALFFARWQACKCSALIQLVDIPTSKCSCLYLRTCKPIFRINMFSYNCCQIQFPSLCMSIDTSISLSLSKFFSVSVSTVFTLTPPFASYVQFPSNSCQGNMELWKHVVLGYGFCERKNMCV